MRCLRQPCVPSPSYLDHRDLGRPLADGDPEGDPVAGTHVGQVPRVLHDKRHDHGVHESANRLVRNGHRRLIAVDLQHETACLVSRGAGRCRQRRTQQTDPRQARHPDPWRLPPRHRLDVAIPLEELPLTRIPRYLTSADEDLLGCRGQLERIARPDDEIRVLACLDRAIPIGDTPDARGAERDGAQGDGTIEAVGNRIPHLLPQSPGSVRFERRERDVNTRFRQPSRVLERRPERIEVRKVGQRLDDDRHLAARDLVGNHPALGRSEAGSSAA